MQSRPDSRNNGQGHRINFVKWAITTMPLLARACSLLTFSPRCRSGAALMPISHLSGRARYTINLEVSALCLKRFWAKIVVKCRSFQSFSFLRSSASFEIRTPLTNASSSCPICNDLRIYLRIEQVSLSRVLQTPALASKHGYLPPICHSCIF